MMMIKSPITKDFLDNAFTSVTEMHYGTHVLGSPLKVETREEQMYNRYGPGLETPVNRLLFNLVIFF